MGIPYFVYSLIGGYLGYFYLSAIVNSAAMNIQVQFLFELLVPVLLGIYLGEKLVGYTVIFYLAYWGSAKPFSMSVVLFYIPSNKILGLKFPISSPTQVIFKYFYYNYPKGCEVQWNFGFEFPDNKNDVEHHYTLLLAIHVSSLGKHLQLFCFFCFLIWIVFLTVQL